jgi:hypothetical protein
MPVLSASLGNDLRERGAADPIGDQDVVGGQDDARDQELGVAGIGVRERILGDRLELVVEFFGDTLAQFVEQRLDVEPRHQHTKQPADAAELGEVVDQGLSGARVLDLHRHLAAIVPGGAVHLADGGGGGRAVVEIGEIVPPVRAEVGHEHPVHGCGRQRRRGFLELGQGGPIGPGDLGGQRRLKDRQGLPELERAALELTEDPEDLLRGSLLDLLRHDLGRSPAEPFPEAERRPSGQTDRQGGEFRRPGHGTAGHIAHGYRGTRVLVVSPDTARRFTSLANLIPKIPLSATWRHDCHTSSRDGAATSGGATASRAGPVPGCHWPPGRPPPPCR